MSDYKLVPVEPTAEMIESATEAFHLSSSISSIVRAALAVAPAVQGEPVAFHMGDASEIVRLLATEKASRRVDNESLGVMGATEVTVWDTKIGLSIELHSGNGGQTAYLYTAPQPAEQQPDASGLVEVLEFYANGEHLMFSDESAWDTVSGEPQNLLCDDAGTATVEDGYFAKAALAAYRKQGGE